MREGMSADRFTVFLCGDVMTGRGVDQTLRHPSRPGIAEPYVRDAREYVELAVSRSGEWRRPVDDAYVWGDALAVLARVAPDVRIINLETSITVSDDYWPAKGINYRMHPDNVGCLTAGCVDVCVLANNHVLDYGFVGLSDTLEALTRARLRTAGAGRTASEAWAPAMLPMDGTSRLAVFGFGVESSGIPPEWAAHADRPGVAALRDLSPATAQDVIRHVRGTCAPGDRVIVSIHWGGNWGYDVSPLQVDFAHRLIEGGVDLVHGHSSHHSRPIEVYRDRLILYGCGDFINDYEGIEGHEPYRADLVVMYFATLSRTTGRLLALEMTPMQIRRMQLRAVAEADRRWLTGTLERISRPFGTRVEMTPDGGLAVRQEAGHRA
jgi:poly-gamma-glutamate capsule biosynthesis protein CapA/YwtB (metallophosphatase superfamily)